MAIHYFNDYSARYKSRNFGDDINPWLLARYLSPELIKRSDVCVLGIGTILNDKQIELVRPYERKVVFSSGAGYGGISAALDDSWHVACVRGPKTAELLGEPLEKAVCDGAFLLADNYDVVAEGKRSRTVFVPHVNTHWSSGKWLNEICGDLGLMYLSPDVEPSKFVDAIRHASLVIAEAMHGAITADAFRTPWIPIEFHFHNKFKWEDMMASLEIPYQNSPLTPKLWNSSGENLPLGSGRLYSKFKADRLKQCLQRVMNEEQPLLSADALLKRKMVALKSCAERINDVYAG